MAIFEPLTDPDVLYNNMRVYGTILLILTAIIVFFGVKFVSHTSQALGPLGVCLDHRGGPGTFGCVLGSQGRPWDLWVCAWITGEALGPLGVCLDHRGGPGTFGCVLGSQGRPWDLWVCAWITGEALGPLGVCLDHRGRLVSDQHCWCGIHGDGAARVSRHLCRGF